MLKFRNVYASCPTKSEGKITLAKNNSSRSGRQANSTGGTKYRQDRQKRSRGTTYRNGDVGSSSSSSTRSSGSTQKYRGMRTTKVSR